MKDDFRVGPWRVRPALNRLSAGGETHQLEPKVAEVLAHLASRPGEVVSRAELQQAVWGSPYVSEDLPRRAVYELRKVLGDDPRSPRYIETIPRAGYRLIAPVEPLAARPPATSDRRRHGWTAGAVLLAAALGLGVLRASRQTAAPALRITPLTASPGVEYDPAFSPDGSRLAYLRTSDSAADAAVTLHVRLLGAESSLQVSDAAADLFHPIESPAWSPDGAAIAYRRWRQGLGWGVFQVPALGGPERKLLELGQVEASGLAFSPDGRWLALAVQPNEDEPLAVHRLSLETLELEALTRPPAATVGDRVPAWSPDGKRLAFLRQVGAEAYEVHVVAADGGESRSLLPERHKIADVDWTADGRRLVLAVHDAGHHRPWLVDAASGEIRRLANLGEGCRWLTVARRGELLAYSRTRFEHGVWRFDLAAGAAEPLPALSSTSYDQELDLSPDGRRLALASTRSGYYEVWILDLGGRPPQRLTSFAGPSVGHPRWSPDGGRIAFHSDRDGGFDLWTADLDGAAPRRLTAHPADEMVPSWSADGALHFASNRSGSWQVWRLADGGEPEQVTRDGGYLARESPDGRWLYHTRWHSDGLWRLPLAGGDAEPVLGEELRSWEWGNWAPSAEGIYYVSTESSGRTHLVLLEPESGQRRRVLTFTGQLVNPSLAFGPDGGFLLAAQVDRVESDLVLVEGYASSP